MSIQDAKNMNILLQIYRYLLVVNEIYFYLNNSLIHIFSN